MARYQLKTQTEIDDLFADYQTRPVQYAVIDEDVCIGCTKCIQACPFDAIMGAAKLMHTVIGSECIGCELCIPPCPVDCIAMATPSKAFKKIVAPPTAQKLATAQHRYTHRLDRIAKETAAKQHKHARAKLLAARKAAIKAAVERAKRKKLINKEK